jgi:hypothetical protein
MSPLLVTALRRLAWLLLLAAVGLVLVFRVLPAFGILGPSAQDSIQATLDAIDTAREYGATPEGEPLRTALEQLEQSRALLAAGEQMRARRTAAAAHAKAIEAQRAALVRRQEHRRLARRTVDEVDQVVNGLERLYSQATRGADRQELARLLSLMKRARAAGARLFLAYEQGNYAQVLAEEQEVQASLESARKQLEAATRRR